MQAIIEDTKTKMDKAMVALNGQLVSIRTGRANPGMLERIEVDYYGSPTPINQMASVSVVEGKQLVIKPFDKSLVKSMEVAMANSDLKFPILNDGDVLRINIPPLTEDTRKELSKDASRTGEDSKVAIRNIRRDANDQIKKDSDVSEDTKKDTQDRVQKLTDEYIKNIDETVKVKIKEIMSI